MGTVEFLVTEFRRHISSGYSALCKKKLSRATLKSEKFVQVKQKSNKKKQRVNDRIKG